MVREHLEKYPNNIFPLLDKNDQPTALLDRNELQNFLKAKQEPNLHSPVLVYPEQTMQEIEGFFEAAPLHTLVMVTNDNRYLGIFTQQEAKHSMEKEEFLATSSRKFSTILKKPKIFCIILIYVFSVFAYLIIKL